jgi:transcriptional regulator with XRE-family HTH domain
MSGKDSDDKQRSNLLSRALRAVRAIRKLKPRALAAALGLSLRGYQNFEAGGAQLNIDHVKAFAQANDADPFGILAAVEIRKPEFAAWVAQNKAMIAFMITLEEFVDNTGEAMVRLETTTWVSAYREMFKGLSEKALSAQDRDKAWLAENAPRLGLGGTLPLSADVGGDETSDDGDEADEKDGDGRGRVDTDTDADHPGEGS